LTEEIVPAMLALSPHTHLPKASIERLKLSKRRAYGFRNFPTTRLRVIASAVNS